MRASAARRASGPWCGSGSANGSDERTRRALARRDRTGRVGSRSRGRDGARMKPVPPHVIVVFGAAGDLSRRKLIANRPERAACALAAKGAARRAAAPTLPPRRRSGSLRSESEASQPEGSVHVEIIARGGSPRGRRDRSGLRVHPADARPATGHGGRDGAGARSLRPRLSRPRPRSCSRATSSSPPCRGPG